jgi:hypothetical protein
MAPCALLGLLLLGLCLLLSLKGCLLLLSEESRVLVRTGGCCDAVGQAGLSCSPGGGVHGRLALRHHGSGEMLCCQLARLLGCEVRVLCPELAL